MKKKLKGLLVCCFLSIVVIGVLYSEGEAKVKVENGAVIIDGKYIEPPYTIEAKENGIWINGALAEKTIPKKGWYNELRKRRVQDEIYAEYFESSEEIGWEKAKEKLKENLANRKEIKGIKIRRAESKNSNVIQIQSDIGRNYDIQIDSSPSSSIEENMFGRLLNKKYGLWYKATGEEEKRAYKDLIGFLDKQKQKGRIEDYKFEKGHDFEKSTLLVKYGVFWGKRSDWDHIWGASVEEKQLPTDEEADRLDRESMKNRIDAFVRALNGNGLEISSRGSICASLPGGKSIIGELKKVMADKNITLEQRKEKIKKVYRPAEMEERFLQEILDNFNK